MNEFAFQLGTGQNLVGVLTPAQGKPSSLAVLLLNAGVVHRIGPHRTSVKLARHLAQQGYTVARFDVSGVGDSRTPHDAAPFARQAQLDILTVMDHLEHQHGMTRFALFGICSGAVMSYETALADIRVVGVFMFDGYAYPTLKKHLIQYALRLKKLTLRQLPLTFVRHASQALGRAFSTGGRQETIAAATALAGRPTRQQYASAIQQMVDRRVQVAMLFSSSVFLQYSYAGQLRDAFKRYGFIDRVACDYVPESDHLVSSLGAQRRLVELLDAWIARIAR